MGTLRSETEVKEQLKFYLQTLKNEVSGIENLTKDYRAFAGNLEKLNTFTEKLYKLDENGNYPEFTEADDQKLLEYYNNAEKSLHQFQKVMRESGVQSGPLNKIVEKIDRMLMRDINSLSALKPEEHMSLAEMLDRGKTLQLNLPKNMSSMHGKSSTRFAMKIKRNSKSEVGFFTEEKKLGNLDGKKLKALGMNYKKEHPEYAELFDKMMDAFDGKSYEEFMTTQDDVCDEIIRGMQEEGRGGKLKPVKAAGDITDALVDDPDMQEYFVPIRNAYTQYVTVLAAEQGTSLGGRNVAMSRIANLLGIHNIVAESTMADAVDENGKTTRGIFMMKAEGVDPNKVMPERIRGLKPDQADTPELLKDIANLQILDYICQNVDRHENNFMYKFNEDGSKLLGIQGIDNDFSFGTVESGDDEVINKIDAPLNAIKVIPKALKRYILAMDDSMIAYALRDTGLKEKEISAVFKRMNKLRERINDGRIRAVENNEWEKMNLKDLVSEAASGNSKYPSLFGIVKFGLDNMADQAERNKEQAEREKTNGAQEFSFKEAENIEALSDTHLTQNAETLQSLIKEMTDSQGKLRIGHGSQEFRDLIDEMKECKDAISDLMNDREHTNYRQVQAKLESIGTMAQEYLATKKANDKNKNAQERMGIARKIQKFSKKEVPEFKNAVHRKEELEMEQMKKAAARKQGTVRKTAEKQRRNSISGSVFHKAKAQNSSFNQMKRSYSMSMGMGMGI